MNVTQLHLCYFHIEAEFKLRDFDIPLYDISIFKPFVYLYKECKS